MRQIKKIEINDTGDYPPNVPKSIENYKKYVLRPFYDANLHLIQIPKEYLLSLVKENTPDNKFYALVCGLIEKESAWRNDFQGIVSMSPTSTATGLMQVTKSTFDDIDFDFPHRYCLIPDYGIYAGVKILKAKIAGAGGNVENGVKNYYSKTDPAREQYAEKVLKNAQKYYI